MGLLKYHCNMWERHPYTLELINNLSSNKVIFKWIFVKHNLFEEINQIVVHNNLSTYPYFSKKIDINNYDIGLKLWVVITQEEK